MTHFRNLSALLENLGFMFYVDKYIVLQPTAPTRKSSVCAIPAICRAGRKKVRRCKVKPNWSPRYSFRRQRKIHFDLKNLLDFRVLTGSSVEDEQGVILGVGDAHLVRDDLADVLLGEGKD